MVAEIPRFPRRGQQFKKRSGKFGSAPGGPAVQQARIKYVLEAIASGSAKDPAAMAAALLKDLSRGEPTAQRPQTFEECNALLARTVEKFASMPFRSDPALGLDYLYPKTRTPLPREEWQRLIRIGSATLKASRFLRGTLNWQSLMDTEAAGKEFAKLKMAMSGSIGMVVMSYHGANAVVAQQFFKKCFEGAALVRGAYLEMGDNKSFGDSRDVLFAALRLLQEGGIILMAPDGPFGRRSIRYQIFDHSVSAGEGAGFLAHAAKSKTAWYSVVRNGDRFAPVVELGPTPQAGESSKDFSNRLMSFYGKKIEESLSGDPRNITLANVKDFLEGPDVASVARQQSTLAADASAL